MAGYNYKLNMSNNAVDAYEKGAKPYNEWSLADIIDLVLEIYDPEEHGFDINKLVNTPLEAVKLCVLSYSSWHHTTKKYKETEFYFVDRKKLIMLTDKDIDKYTYFVSQKEM